MILVWILVHSWAPIRQTEERVVGFISVDPILNWEIQIVWQMFMILHTAHHLELCYRDCQ